MLDVYWKDHFVLGEPVWMQCSFWMARQFLGGRMKSLPGPCLLYPKPLWGKKNKPLHPEMGPFCISGPSALENNPMKNDAWPSSFPPSINLEGERLKLMCITGKKSEGERRKNTFSGVREKMKQVVRGFLSQGSRQVLTNVFSFMLNWLRGVSHQRGPEGSPGTQGKECRSQGP